MINEIEIETNQTIQISMRIVVRGKECKDFRIGSDNTEISCVLLNDLKTHTKHWLNH